MKNNKAGQYSVKKLHNQRLHKNNNNAKSTQRKEKKIFFLKDPSKQKISGKSSKSYRKKKCKKRGKLKTKKKLNWKEKQTHFYQNWTYSAPTMRRPCYFRNSIQPLDLIPFPFPSCHSYRSFRMASLFLFEINTYRRAALVHIHTHTHTHFSSFRYFFSSINLNQFEIRNYLMSVLD